MASGKKFIRAANFTNEEEHKIVDSVEKYKHIIECKKSDSLTWKEKERVWQIVVDEFNATAKRPRSVKEIKLKYACLKKAAKKEASKQMQSLRGTGGGPFVPPTPSNNGILDRVVKLVPLAATGMPSVTDSDYIRPLANPYMESSDEDEPDNLHDWQDYPASDAGSGDIELTCSVLDSRPGCSGMQAAAAAKAVVIAKDPNESGVAQEYDWSQYSPAMLRRPKHPALNAASKSTTPDESVPLPANEKYAQLQRATEAVLVNKGSTSTSCRRRPKLVTKETISSASTAKYSALAVAKTELAKLQKELLLEEHTAREARLAEEHELRMRLRKAELKLAEIKILNAEADLKIKYSKLNNNDESSSE